MFRPKPLALPVTNHTLSINTSLCCLVNRSFELCPQLGGCRPFPRSESSIKRMQMQPSVQIPHARKTSDSMDKIFSLTRDNIIAEQVDADEKSLGEPAMMVPST